jgi:hypothetical protein
VPGHRAQARKEYTKRGAAVVANGACGARCDNFILEQFLCYICLILFPGRRRLAANVLRGLIKDDSKQKQACVKSIVQRVRSLTTFCSVSYDPITLEYNQDTEGETLKYMDDIVKWKVGQHLALFSFPSRLIDFIYTFIAGETAVC